ncbi:MAG TPA: NUDIX hydrolase [Sphingomicrobium sp.]|nr:NUDIX hydrolase [Sphingomicrobium sp.]
MRPVVQRQWPDLPLRVGALPFRETDAGRVDILLIRRLDRHVWTVPKGRLVAGRTDHESAELEAFEEAGVAGSISETAIGSFLYNKAATMKPEHAEIVEVALFPMMVDCELPQWPEMAKRERRWFRQHDVARFVLPGELRDLLTGFTAREFNYLASA